MNGNFFGMDPELAKVAMQKIVDKKNDLVNESRSASSALKDKVNNAFAGAQTSSMQSYIDQINTALEGLYSYLDGNESNFAQKFNEIIQSYVASDENVNSSYNSTEI